MDWQREVDAGGEVMWREFAHNVYISKYRGRPDEYGPFDFAEEAKKFVETLLFLTEEK